jgi:hypothetical protein
MKITIYELLGLIKDGKAPKKIKYKGNTYIAKGNGIDGFVGYFDEDDILDYELIHYVAYKDLNAEIEIIKEVEEDEFEDIEELDLKNIYKCDDYQQIYINFKHTWNKINALIKNQKKIINEIKDK